MQLLQLDRFQTGAIVLAGLFFYDIYWVFGTDVMVSVAVGLDAPIKLLFLREFASHDTSAQHQMLGLGDIGSEIAKTAALGRTADGYAQLRSELPE